MTAADCKCWEISWIKDNFTWFGQRRIHNCLAGASSQSKKYYKRGKCRNAYLHCRASCCLHKDLWFDGARRVMMAHECCVLAHETAEGMEERAADSSRDFMFNEIGRSCAGQSEQSCDLCCLARLAKMTVAGEDCRILTAKPNGWGAGGQPDLLEF